LTGQAISDTGSTVGRPPIKRDVETKPLLVRMDGDMHKRIVQCVGKKRMAQFARDAIEEKLQREEASTARPSKPSPAEG